MPQIFDRIMQNSMAIWMLVSGLFPIFVVGTVVKAVLHQKRVREVVRSIPVTPVVPTWMSTDDWVPTP